MRTPRDPKNYVTKEQAIRELRQIADDLEGHPAEMVKWDLRLSFWYETKGVRVTSEGQRFATGQTGELARL